MHSARPPLILAVAIAAATASLEADFNPETGAYLFQRYSTKQYGASPQNWGIAQDQRGIMYFANTDGVLEFDGNSWRMIRLPDRASARAVSVDGAGTVYVGGVGNFGSLMPDSTGTMRFVSLIDRIPQQDRGFAEVRKILTTPQGVYFRATNRLFRLNHDGSVKVWRPQKRLNRVFYVSNVLYAQTSDVGLARLSEDGKLSPVQGGERFAGDLLNATVPFHDDALIMSETRLYRLTPQGVEPFSTAADSYIAKNLGYTMQILPTGQIAVGTRNGGLVLLSRDGALDRILSTANGLADDYVADVFIDSQGGIWLAHNNGITRFNLGLSHYGKSEGIEGDVETMARHAGALYAGTTAGLFRLTAKNGVGPQFDHIDGIDATVWALASQGKDFMVATDRGVFLVSEDYARKIFESDRAVYDLSTSPRDPNMMYAVRRAFVNILERRGTGWAKAAEFEAPGEDFRSVLEDADGRVWATTKKNIWRLDFRGNGSGDETVRSEKFGEPQGVPTGWIYARRLRGRVVFATTKGLRYYDEATKSFLPDLSLGTQFADGSHDVFNIFDDAAGNVWVTGEAYHGVLLHRTTGYRWLPMPLLRSGISEIYWMSTDLDGTVWSTGADYILNRWDPAIAGEPDRDFRVTTRRVQVIGGADSWYGGAGKPSAMKLPWRDNALRFEFAAPFYEEPSAVEYQVLLEGSDNVWSAWSHESTRDYTHLPEGSYRFRVRARSPHGAIAEDAALGFGVLPPWYRTWWAYLLYTAVGGLGLWGVVRLRTRQLEADKRNLESVVEARTIEVRQQRDEIKAQERKTHSLLLSILPAKVADELKTTGSVKPVAFEDVTVCFTDFVGFTLASERMAPGLLVETLNMYFTRFDEIISRYGLEKLKTMGDSYMFASGLPVRRASHAVDAVLAALEIVEAVKEMAALNEGSGWNIRVGLHSGPVVAGVVGIRKFAFDIWGNTVNFAARMESSGVPGRVNMSERTYRLTRGLIDCEARGHIGIKEGRKMEMFLAEGPARQFLQGELKNGIPESFAARYSEEFSEQPRSFPEWNKALAAS
jgi:class 3 adenylate cyclase